MEQVSACLVLNFGNAAKFICKQVEACSTCRDVKDLKDLGFSPWRPAGIHFSWIGASARWCDLRYSMTIKM